MAMITLGIGIGSLKLLSLEFPLQYTLCVLTCALTMSNNLFYTCRRWCCKLELKSSYGHYQTFGFSPNFRWNENISQLSCHIKWLWENIQGNSMYEQICLNCKFLCFRKWCCNRARQNTDWYTKVCTDWAGKGILDWDEGSKLLLSEINHSNHKWSCFTRINGRSCCLLFLSACQVVNLSNSDSYKVGGNTPCCIFCS